MNSIRTLLSVAAVAAAALLATSVTRSQGPDEKGAVLIGGFGDAPRPAPGPTTPAAAQRPQPSPMAPTAAPMRPSTDRSDEYLKNFFGVESSDGSKIKHGTIVDLEEKPDINHDIQVTPAVGPWVIFLIGCTGEKGPIQARKMVTEMRGNPAYRLNAYVFYYGAEERRKENERVKKLIAEQTKVYRDNNLTPDEGLKVRHRVVDVQYAVLLGGYRDQDSARAALERMRKLPAPDPNKVDLEIRYSGALQNDKIVDAGKGSFAHYVNPFTRAFVCRNPTVQKQDGPKSKEDVLKELAELRGLNSGEPLSLFNCPKAVTLAVKGYQTPCLMKGQETTSNSFLGALNPSAQKKDYAMLQSHELADKLRMRKLEAYVLHTPFSSIVTVGSFDSLEDPALKLMQNELATKLNQGFYSQIQFFQQPVPMPVPR